MIKYMCVFISEAFMCTLYVSSCEWIYVFYYTRGVNTGKKDWRQSVSAGTVCVCVCARTQAHGRVKFTHFLLHCTHVKVFYDAKSQTDVWITYIYFKKISLERDGVQSLLQAIFTHM